MGMKKYFCTIFLITIFLVIIKAQIDVNSVKEENELRRSSSSFASKMYKQLNLTKKDNILISPLSLQLVLGLLQMGAANVTATEISDVVETPLEKLHLENYLEKLYKSLKQNNNENLLSISIANAVYIRPDIRVNETFFSIAKNKLNSDIRSLTLTGSNENIITSVNNWISDKTNGQIKDVLREGDITVDTAMLLINALHFKGNWMFGFDSEQTKLETFYYGNNQSLVHMMKSVGYFHIGRDSDLKITYIQLPYMDDYNSESSDYVLGIYLPDDTNGLKIIQENLNQLLLTPPATREEHVDIRLPRFKISTKYQLKEPLENMGIKSAFSNADLSYLTTDKRMLAVGKVIHNAQIDVNEKGTEASASTVLDVVDRIFSQPILVNANKPFLFVLKQNSTGILLFIGHYTGEN